MRENLKIYTDQRHDDTGINSKFLATFAHVWNRIQMVMNNGPENPGTRLTSKKKKKKKKKAHAHSVLLADIARTSQTANRMSIASRQGLFSASLV